MTEFQEMYTILFNAITDTINVLQEAQEKVELLYVERSAANGNVIDFPEI